MCFGYFFGALTPFGGGNALMHQIQPRKKKRRKYLTGLKNNFRSVARCVDVGRLLFFCTFISMLRIPN